MKHSAISTIRAAAGKTILVVHEDASILLLIEALLHGAGYNVLLADDPASVSALAPVDLCIADSRLSRGPRAVNRKVRTMSLPVEIENGIIRVKSGFLEEVRRLLAGQRPAGHQALAMPARAAMAVMR